MQERIRDLEAALDALLNYDEPWYFDHEQRKRCPYCNGYLTGNAGHVSVQSGAVQDCPVVAARAALSRTGGVGERVQAQQRIRVLELALRNARRFANAVTQWDTPNRAQLMDAYHAQDEADKALGYCGCPDCSAARDAEAADVGTGAKP